MAWWQLLDARGANQRDAAVGRRDADVAGQQPVSFSVLRFEGEQHLRQPGDHRYSRGSDERLQWTWERCKREPGCRGCRWNCVQSREGRLHRCGTCCLLKVGLVVCCGELWPRHLCAPTQTKNDWNLSATERLATAARRHLRMRPLRDAFSRHRARLRYGGEKHVRWAIEVLRADRFKEQERQSFPSAS